MWFRWGLGVECVTQAWWIEHCTPGHNWFMNKLMCLKLSKSTSVSYFQYLCLTDESCALLCLTGSCEDTNVELHTAFLPDSWNKGKWWIGTGSWWCYWTPGAKHVPQQTYIWTFQIHDPAVVFFSISLVRLVHIIKVSPDKANSGIFDKSAFCFMIKTCFTVQLKCTVLCEKHKNKKVGRLVSFQVRIRGQYCYTQHNELKVKIIFLSELKYKLKK